MNIFKSLLKLSTTLLLLVFLAGTGAAYAQSQQLARLDISTEVQKAIDNGVRLVFDAHYAEQKTIFIFSRFRTVHQHRFFVQRHSLSNRYIVRRDKLEIPRLFRSIPQAMRYISQQALELLEFYKGEDLVLYMRLSLNKYELPGPLRLNAFIAADWDIDTGWMQPPSAQE